MLALLIMVVTVFGAEKITFATGEWAPFISEEEEGYGIHAKRVKKIFEAMGYEVEFEFLPWKRAYTLVKRGKLPASFSWMHTKEREDEMFYPKHHLAESQEVVFYRKDKFPDGIKFNELCDLKDYKFAGIKSYWYEKALRDCGIFLHTISDAAPAWRFINKGRADLMIENIDVGPEMLKDALGDEAANFTHSKPVKSSKMYVIFSRVHDQGKELMEAFDKKMEELGEKAYQ